MAVLCCLSVLFRFLSDLFLRAVLEGSLFWGGSSCVVDVPQGLMTSVPYDQPNCWFFCLPATASGPSIDSLACTSMRKDWQDKAAAYPDSPLEDPLSPWGWCSGLIPHCSAALWTFWRHGLRNYFPRCSSSSQYKYWDAMDFFFPPSWFLRGFWGICVLCSQNVIYNPSFYLLNFP